MRRKKHRYHNYSLDEKYLKDLNLQPGAELLRRLVELIGIEPTTS